MVISFLLITVYFGYSYPLLTPDSFSPIFLVKHLDNL